MQSVAIVTGASRGAGAGIAAALGDAGYVVYVTGRTRAGQSHELGGTIDETAAEVTRRGGVGIPVVCDHSSVEDMEALAERVRRDHGGLDVLVNNALAIDGEVLDPAPFWEKSLDQLSMLDVGLRSTLVMTRAAARLLLARSSSGPLVVNTSGFGGACYMHGPAYGAVKAGVDKLAHDMAVDFAPFGVSVVSIWMGLLLTARTERVLDAEPEKYGGARRITESPEFTGRVIAALHADPQRMAVSGRVLIGAEEGARLGVLDVDGSSPRSRRGILGEPPTFSAVVVR
ncbi:MAG TPA: SDR family NAD(P)-dependent oxidoreductase [Marmoricola sp.]|nr:SDR family NAD(P)-dependent oxidoreductase [Marmoricola sp.]